jgi:anti-sigma B factor antagonist
MASPYSTREESGIRVVVFEESAGFSGLRDPSRRDQIYAAVPDRDNPRVVFNLKNADYLSSFGVATLIGLKRRIEGRGGKVVFCHIQPSVREILAMMNLEPLFTIADDEASAISSLRSLPTA